jgi:hypothetical protein
MLDGFVLDTYMQVISKPKRRQCNHKQTTKNINVLTKTNHLTGDQHKDHILKGQRIIQHSSQPDVFYFFPHRTFLKTILASRTLAHLVLPRNTSQRFAKPKEPILPSHQRQFCVY